MRKFTLLLAAAFVTVVASAKILRVSNVTGSSAPYSTLADAVAAAADGDTIMVEGSANAYESAVISKKLVVKGPGYWLVENGITQNGDEPATFKGDWEIVAEGVKLEGLVVESSLKIKASYVTVTRCTLKSKVEILSSATHPVISRNFMNGGISGDMCTFALITNNIFAYYFPAISAFDKSTIMYNTMIALDGNALYNVHQSTISNNFMKDDASGLCSGLTYTDNVYWKNATDLNFNNSRSTDTAVRNRQNEISELAGFPDNVGAWAGDAPYVISGVPAGPVIESVKMPVSVEQGKQLPVTVTIKLQQ